MAKPKNEIDLDNPESKAKIKDALGGYRQKSSKQLIRPSAMLQRRLIHVYYNRAIEVMLHCEIDYRSRGFIPNKKLAEGISYFKIIFREMQGLFSRRSEFNNPEDKIIISRLSDFSKAINENPEGETASENLYKNLFTNFDDLSNLMDRAGIKRLDENVKGFEMWESVNEMFDYGG